ncbi:putative Integral membrane protein [Streptomyces viridochromogenes Tue57]|uniref:Putative Integral membrane protein n=2 Tax=Streptomyces viridochromogenes TaxID=1938 RepID=L8PCW8_STRVR|nr:putative Integral membrane protein [Streptomyces viridochromogenes Tue57]
MTMTDQPYEGHDGYDGYDPYRQQAPQAWPGQQHGYDDPQADAQQYTQQWQGQTWETQVQPPVAPAPGAETAYVPPQQGAPQQGAGAYGEYRGGDASGYQTAGWDGMPQGQAQHAQGRQSHVQPHGHAPWHSQSQSQAQHRSRTRTQAPQPEPAETEAGPGDGPDYGPATVAGNARVTDAQRARLEGRSPIIEPGMQPAALTALLGLLLSASAAVGTYALLVPLVVLQAVTAAGWFRLNGMWPARQGIALAFAGALTADVALLAADHAPAAILGTLGVWVLLALVLQLRSHADPDERMYGLMATVASAALSIVAAGYLAADADAVTVGALAVAVAVVARALPLPTPASVVVSLLAAAGAGVAGGAMTGVGSGGALLGAGAAVCALIGHRVASYDYPSRFVHFTAGVALPLAAAAPVVYVLGRALV